MSTTVTGVDPRVAQEIATQLQCAAEEIAELRENIATARPLQLKNLAQRLSDELAYQSQMRLIEAAMENEVNEQQDPRLVLLAQFKELAEISRRVAYNGHNKSRDEVEARGRALAAVQKVVYYALYDDLREAGFRGSHLG